VTLDASVEREVCPHNLVPTTSALAALALGDALAMAVMNMHGLTPGDVGRFHPGGHLGRKLSARVRDVMQNQHLPVVTPERKVSEALFTMTAGRCGLAVVVDEGGEAIGIITDGDLRRALQQRPGLLDLAVSEIMTAQPVTIHEDATLHEAEERMHRLRLKALVVIDHGHRVSGVIEIFNGH
jgi:arabinose-5-phosphate isomerase